MKKRRLRSGESFAVGKGGFTEVFPVKTDSPEWQTYEEQWKQIKRARRATVAAARGIRPPEEDSTPPPS
ncbi:MAG: hypothetical protein LC799_27545 [Actinobacteria bacterium]|nr:hypothetical protein [Actinomycetota bacterium]